MNSKQYRMISKQLLWLFCAAIVVNFVFFLLMFGLPANQKQITDKVRLAFTSGDLVVEDYLPFDARRGWHQYNDCVVLQILANEDTSRLKRALAPLIYVANDDWSDQCATLQRLLEEEPADKEAFIASRYARYWHGYNLLTALGLHVVSLQRFRQTLAITVWLAIIFFVAVTFRRGPHTRLVGLSIGLSAASIWAVPYFAPSITHGPGDAWLLLGLACYALWPGLASRPGTTALFAVVFGATVIFFEMGTGQLPVAAAWLVALSLAVARDNKKLKSNDLLALILIIVVGFGFGAVFSIMAKQVLVALLVEISAGGQFFTNLRLYMTVPPSEEGWPGILVPFGRLIRKSDVLTYNNLTASYSLIAFSAILWVVALWQGRQRIYHQRQIDLLILSGAALVPIVWILIMPYHTYIHAAFMARILVVPISLAPTALFWHWVSASADRSTSCTTGEGNFASSQRS
jgi:hypothetical protein